MAEKRDREKPAKKKPPTHAIGSERNIPGITDHDVEMDKLLEITDLVKMPPSLSETEQQARILRALDLYESIEPGDSIEGMLAVQMVGTHFAIQECLRLAAVSNQTFEARDMNLKHAAKLTNIYTRQMAALDKHRGKGQQKVTVEHVHVEAGGQAVVGNIEAGGQTRHQENPEPRVIEDKPSVSMKTSKAERKRSTRVKANKS